MSVYYVIASRQCWLPCSRPPVRPHSLMAPTILSFSHCQLAICFFASSFNSKLYGCIHISMMNLTWHFQNACVWRAATAMRRASNRIPKRSLDTDFELSQVESHQKGRAGARRGPVGPSKVRKAAFTSTGTVIPQGMGHSCFCLSAAAAETLCPSTSPKGQAC